MTQESLLMYLKILKSLDWGFYLKLNQYTRSRSFLCHTSVLCCQEYGIIAAYWFIKNQYAQKAPDGMLLTDLTTLSEICQGLKKYKPEDLFASENDYQSNLTHLASVLLTTDSAKDSQNFIKKEHHNIHKKHKNIVGVQRVRGDGDCYFRAVIYGQFERTILASPSDRNKLFNYYAKLIKNELLDQENTCFKRDGQDEKPIKQLISKLEQAAQGQAWNHLQAFRHDMMSLEQSGEDYLLIKAFGSNCRPYLKKALFCFSRDITTAMLLPMKKKQS